MLSENRHEHFQSSAGLFLAKGTAELLVEHGHPIFILFPACFPGDLALLSIEPSPKPSYRTQLGSGSQTLTLQTLPSASWPLLRSSAAVNGRSSIDFNGTYDMASAQDLPKTLQLMVGSKGASYYCPEKGGQP